MVARGCSVVSWGPHHFRLVTLLRLDMKACALQIVHHIKGLILQTWGLLFVSLVSCARKLML